ncbi:MAG: CRISPR system precrRNA processing endoribonuclease RAMP protein Cas6 [Syntrophales bacterium]|nr:CRISPR system precrRNA processing endoribonuclease RAMP protein Cas6 [Syntrophales bacterium]
MLYGRYIFFCTFKDDAVLPEYKGSTFRGVFGHALKKVVCALRREDCSDCLLRSRCVYALVFETPQPINAFDRSPAAFNPSSEVSSVNAAAFQNETMRRSSAPGTVRQRVAAPPHPYVIEPDATPQTRYRQGESFDFTLLLFGHANDYLPYFVYAFDQVGQLGIGKRIDGKRATFSLREVRAGNIAVFSAESGRIIEGAFTENLLPQGCPDDKPGAVNALEINLLTPLRLKYENHLEASLPFHIIIRAALRRISTLLDTYGAGEPALDYRGLVARARYIEIVSSSLRWFDWQRYSNRQDQAMLMGGMIGKIQYAGDLGEFIPLLRFCEKVHLGKQTTFGLGKFSMHLPRP